MMFDNHIKENPFLGFAGFGGGISWVSIQKYLDTVYVEDVFSTYVWEGTGSTQTITNGIDLAGEGGMIWTKGREVISENHMIHDSVRGKTGSYYDALQTNVTNADYTDAPYGPTSFNSDGFTLDGNNAQFNGSTDGSYCSWTFRKAPGFFDVVTYTGNGTTQSISHSLGSTPGWIVVKRTDSTGEWTHLHRNDGTTWKQVAGFNTNALVNANGTVWGSDVSTFVAPTNSSFTVGQYGGVNASGGTYVAYIFAHDDARFGDNSDQSIIKCGTYTGNGLAAGPVVNLGWEPQWVLIKRTDSAASWYITDSIRGLTYQDTDVYLVADTNSSEGTLQSFSPLYNGFQLNTNSFTHNANGGTYVYMAIRRPHKPPESATDVFAAAVGQNVTTAGDLAYDSGFPIDWIVEGWNTANFAYDRFMPTYDYFRPSETNVSAADGGFRSLVSNEGSPYDTIYDLTAVSAVGWCFRRAPGFFDLVAYTGTGANRTVDHSLGVAPELFITKNMDSPSGSVTYNATIGATKRLLWDTNAAEFTSSTVWNNTAPTESVFSLGTASSTNNSGDRYHAYLFASLDGISKVGTYTGTGADLDIDCGFAAGARFVMIKRTDSTGNWYVFDTTTGIVTGNEDYRKIDDGNLVSGQDYIDPFSSGFALSSAGSTTTNINTATYIYLAIA